MSNPGEIIGPPQDNPFERLDDKQRAKLDRALAIADGVKLYHAAGGAGVAANWAPFAQDLAKRGGLSPDEALTLSRYRMFKQGAPILPLGPREPDPTPEDVAQRRDRFIAGTPQERSQMMDEDKFAIARSHQGYFDSLVQKAAEIVDDKKPAKKVADNAE